MTIHRLPVAIQRRQEIRSFVVRCWPSEGGDSTQLRGRVQITSTGKVHYFETPEQLVDLIGVHVLQPPSGNEPVSEPIHLDARRQEA